MLGLRAKGQEHLSQLKEVGRAYQSEVSVQTSVAAGNMASRRNTYDWMRKQSVRTHWTARGVWLYMD